MNKPKRLSPFIFEPDLYTGTLMATFGSKISENRLHAYHCEWNAVLHRMHLKPCWFDPTKPNTGCRLPMCPKCSIRARMKLLKNVLSWHWRTPSAPLSLYEFRLSSVDPEAFITLFDDRIARRPQARNRGATSMRAIGLITTSASAGKMRRSSLFLDDGEPATHRRWTHRRMKVLWHDPASEVPQLRGGRPIVDQSMISQTFHHSWEQMLDDGSVWDYWRDPDHAGKVMVGALLNRFDNISDYLVDGGAPAADFVAELRQSRQRLTYYRTFEPPGSWDQARRKQR